MLNIEIKETEYYNCPYCHRIIPDYAICNCTKNYNQALEDFLKEFHKHLCDENCGDRKCIDNMDKCVYWFYANETYEKLTK